MFSRWILENGASRGTSTSGRRSFRATSAARSMRLLQAPWRPPTGCRWNKGDHHGIGRAGAGGRRRHPVVLAEHADLSGGGTAIFGEEGLHRLRLGRQGHVGLGGHHQLRGLGDQEVHLALFLHQAIEQAQAVLGAGGAVIARVMRSGPLIAPLTRPAPRPACRASRRSRRCCDHHLRAGPGLLAHLLDDRLQGIADLRRYRALRGVAARSQPRFGGAYQSTWSAWRTLSGRPSR